MDTTKKNSLLIIDDEKSNVLTLTHILSPEYNIHVARDGQSAIEVANEYLPDVILLDILMPGVDGYDVITALKNSERTRATPVIFISGLDDAVDEEKGLSLGAADYISKPYSPAIVKLRVRNQIELRNYIKLIERLSSIDQLTDIPNRRGFDERLTLEWNRAIRDRTPISVLFMDIDYFKNYNDTYGHQQGDVALRTVAQVFTLELKRSVDFIARIGGEEFVVLLTNTDEINAQIVAERLRARIENLQIPLQNGQFSSITISVGINTLIPTPETLVNDFIHQADNALYVAKNTGRNQVHQAR